VSKRPIFPDISACVALYETIDRLIHPQQLSNLWVLALVGLVGFVGNEIAAQVRLRAVTSRSCGGFGRNTGLDMQRS
jgi:hypothetical protein